MMKPCAPFLYLTDSRYKKGRILTNIKIMSILYFIDNIHQLNSHLTVPRECFGGPQNSLEFGAQCKCLYWKHRTFGKHGSGMLSR